MNKKKYNKAILQDILSNNYDNIKIISEYKHPAIPLVVLNLDNGFEYYMLTRSILKGALLYPRNVIDKTAFAKYRLNKKQPDLELISEYIKERDSVLVKDLLGIKYKVNFSALLRGVVPSILTAVNKNKCFITKANALHNHKYNYSDIDYIDSRLPLLVECPIHGTFMVTPSNHLMGGGCPKCAHVGWNKSSWVKSSNRRYNNDPKVYIIRCFNNQEEFIKIGITYTSITNRFTPNRMPYSYEVLKEIKGSADFVWDKEKELHRQYKQYRYKPLIPFAGETECFNMTILNFIKS